MSCAPPGPAAYGWAMPAPRTERIAGDKPNPRDPRKLLDSGELAAIIDVYVNVNKSRTPSAARRPP